MGMEARRERGATLPEYAIGVAVIAAAIIAGVGTLEDKAHGRYDERQTLLATPVTDLTGSPTTTTLPGATTTVTLPPALTTTTTAPATTTSTTSATTTSTTAPVTTTTTPSISFSATAERTKNNKWVINYSLTSTAPSSTTFTIKADGTTIRTCTLATQACAGTTGEFNDNAVTQTVTVTPTSVVGFNGPSPTSIDVAVPPG
jgi:Flp pilus assembly pilin Flp